MALRPSVAATWSIERSRLSFNSVARKILRNGAEQKSKNGPQNLQTALIGKKAGKKKNLKPGDRIQVRNPSGTISEEFIFTGS
jgi:hypothetical protein